MQDCHRGLLRAAEKDGRLTAAPEQVYDTVVKRLRQKVTQGGNNQRVARRRRGVPGSEARLRVCRELLTRGACSQGDLCLHDHDPARVKAARSIKQKRNAERKVRVGGVGQAEVEEMPSSSSLPSRPYSLPGARGIAGDGAA